jgi:hypothetical protein
MMTGTPYDLLRNLGSHSEDWRPQWADHLSVISSEGDTYYIAEPYQLYPEAFHDFELLEAHGWRVVIDGQSTHYPGRTVRVRISLQPEQ